MKVIALQMYSAARKFTLSGWRVDSSSSPSCPISVAGKPALHVDRCATTIHDCHHTVGLGGAAIVISSGLTALGVYSALPRGVFHQVSQATV